MPDSTEKSISEAARKAQRRGFREGRILGRNEGTRAVLEALQAEGHDVQALLPDPPQEIREEIDDLAKKAAEAADPIPDDGTAPTLDFLAMAWPVAFTWEQVEWLRKPRPTAGRDWLLSRSLIEETDGLIRVSDKGRRRCGQNPDVPPYWEPDREWQYALPKMAGHILGILAMGRLQGPQAGSSEKKKLARIVKSTPNRKLFRVSLDILEQNGLVQIEGETVILTNAVDRIPDQ